MLAAPRPKKRGGAQRDRPRRAGPAIHGNSTTSSRPGTLHGRSENRDNTLPQSPDDGKVVDGRSVGLVHIFEGHKGGLVFTSIAKSTDERE